MVSRNGNLRETTSMLTMAACLTLVSTPVLGQSFQGSSNVVFGSATIDTPTINGTPNTNVLISSASAVIDSLPFDTEIADGFPIEFQPASTQANFSNATPGDNFVVLNRIVPVDTSRPVQFNGTVVSRLQSAAGSAPGGDGILL